MFACVFVFACVLAFVFVIKLIYEFTFFYTLIGVCVGCRVGACVGVGAELPPPPPHATKTTVENAENNKFSFLLRCILQALNIRVMLHEFSCFTTY